MTTLHLEEPADAAAPVTVVRARGLRLNANRGAVYGPVDLDIPTGSLTVLTGPAGSGKTALLLTLIGRMRPSSGSELNVLGHDLPRQARAVQKRTSGTGFNGLDDLDEEVSVAASVRERMAWLAPWYSIIHTPSDEAIAAICAQTFGDVPVPTGKQIVHELDESTNLLLRIALAMMSDPDIIAVDQIDQLLDTSERDIVWRRLHALTRSGLTVITSTSGRSEVERIAWDVAPTIIHLPEAKER